MRKFCVMMILLSFILALFAPLISSYDPNLVDLSKAKIAPNLSHIFGTDLLGRDVFTRILYALRVSLFVGIMAAFFSVLFACVYVFLTRFFAYAFFARVIDMLLALPSLLVIMFFQSFLAGSLWSMIFIIALGHFAFVAKVLDTQLNKFQKLEFYQNAIILGSSKMKALFSELLPACWNLIFVLFVLNIAHAITSEATLSFFGLGVELWTPSLGNMLNEASKAVFLGFWWMIVFPVAFILMLILPLLALGNDLQEEIKA
ncbi:ABC transporter permease [Campylobacter lari]|nr:ABC transporter permease [Campylobacter lari]